MDRVASVQYITDSASRVAESVLYCTDAVLGSAPGGMASVQYRKDSASRVVESVLYCTDAVLRGAVGIYASVRSIQHGLRKWSCGVLSVRNGRRA